MTAPSSTVDCNEAVILQSPLDLSLAPYSFPTVGDQDCLIEIKSVGICGSDVHYWQHGRIGDFVLREPMIIGHESAGIVKAIGPKVEGLQVGDRVALEPGIPCSSCEFCVADKYNLCPEIRFFATPPVHGSLQRFVAHPSSMCFKLPVNVSLEEGAMCEPLSVGVYACGPAKADVKPGHTVCIFGAGPIGIICALVAFGLGAEQVLLTDIQESRLEIAKKFVPRVTCLLAATDDSIMAETGGVRVDSSIDCCGAEAAVQVAMRVTKNGGVVCLVGMGCALMSLPVLQASCREVSLLGVFRYRHTYPVCLDLISSKKVDVSSLITHRFTFDNDSVLQAFHACKEGKGPDGFTAVKCMINID